MDGASETVAGHTYTVIVADDHEDDRFLVRRALERHGGFSVVAEAATGAEAVDAAIAHRPDLIVIDLAMPDLDGLMATTALRTASPDTTVVVLSNFGSSRMQQPALLAGAAAYLEKSLPPQQLVESILEALRAEARARAVTGGGPPGDGPPAGDGPTGDGPAADGPATDISRAILTADGLAPMVARRFVSRALDERGLGARRDEVLLLVSELVTNAVVHANSDLEVVMRHTPQMLRVEVHDRDPRRVAALAWTDDQERGRGVALVEALSDVWGTDDEQIGKVIWFEMAI